MSAPATASMYRLHTCERISGVCVKGHCNLWLLLVIGYFGSIGIATLSDSIIPYLGELMLNLPNRGIHLGFIEKWWLVNPLAVAGVLIACYRPSTVTNAMERAARPLGAAGVRAENVRTKNGQGIRIRVELKTRDTRLSAGDARAFLKAAIEEQGLTPPYADFARRTLETLILKRHNIPTLPAR